MRGSIEDACNAQPAWVSSCCEEFPQRALSDSRIPLQSAHKPFRWAMLQVYAIVLDVHDAGGEEVRDHQGHDHGNGKASEVPQELPRRPRSSSR